MLIYFITVNYLQDRKQIRNLIIAIIMVFVIVCFASIAQIPQGEASQYQEQVGGVTLDTSTSERVSSMKKAWEAYTEHPIFGYGITGWRFLDAQYLKTLVETGMLGFAAFGFMIYTILKETGNGYRRFCTA